MSNGCAPVLASYSAITLFTSSMSAVAGSYSRSVLSPRDENVSILAFMFGLLRDVHGLSAVGAEPAGLGPWMSYGTVSDSCQDGTPRCNEDRVVFPYRNPPLQSSVLAGLPLSETEPFLSARNKFLCQ